MHQNGKQLFIVQCRQCWTMQVFPPLLAWIQPWPLSFKHNTALLIPSGLVIHTPTLKAWKNMQQFKVWTSPGWDDSQNIYKGAGRHLLHLIKAFSSLWGGVSLLSTVFISSMHLEEAKGCTPLVALYLKHLVTLFSVWLGSKSNPESFWQSLVGNQIRL